MNACETHTEFAMSNKERKVKFLLIKTRPNQWENEVYNNNAQTLTKQFCFNGGGGDRFIPKRFNRDDIELNSRFVKKHEIKDIMTANITPNYWRQNNFVAAINNVFGIEKRRLLEFSTCGAECKSAQAAPRMRTDLDWPCCPRPKPLSYTDTTHDMPELDARFETDCNLMDWSAKDQLAVSIGEKVIIWKSRDEVTMVFHLKCPSSLSFSPNGEYLAIGCIDCDFPVLELWKVNTRQDFLIVGGKFFNRSNLAVTCIEWSKYGYEIVCGTRSGNIFVLSVPKLRAINKIINHKTSVSIIRFSPTMRYLASADIQGNVTIYRWCTQQTYLHVRSKNNSAVTLDWHPWNGVDIAISEKIPPAIIILHVPTQEVVATYQRHDSCLVIYSINFSKLTGELLVSVSRRERNGDCQWLVLVMSSLVRMVDILDIPETGARFMMWSPDGTKLSTASLDESLTIWNFYPEHKRRRNRQCKKNRIESELLKWICLK